GEDDRSGHRLGEDPGGAPRPPAPPGQDRVQRRWGRAFAIASVVTPILLGTTIGALMSGRIEVRDGVLVSGFVGSWLGAFPLAVGLLCLVLFSYLAAVYLAVEADDEQVREDFRR